VLLRIFLEVDGRVPVYRVEAERVRPVLGLDEKKPFMNALVLFLADDLFHFFHWHMPDKLRTHKFTLNRILCELFGSSV
jgi:hypothetical protein